MHSSIDFSIDFAMIFASCSDAFMTYFHTWWKCRNPRNTRKFSNGSRVAAFSLAVQYFSKYIKNRWKHLSFFNDFSCFFHLRIPLKNTPKTFKNSLKKHLKNQTIFECIREEFSLQNHYKIPPENPQKHSKKPSWKHSEKKTKKNQPKTWVSIEREARFNKQQAQTSGDTL